MNSGSNAFSLNKLEKALMFKKTTKKLLICFFRGKKHLVKSQFRKRMGYDLDLHNPRTFNEKLNWMKIYYRNSDAYNYSDKYNARLTMQRAGYGALLPEIYGVWDNPKKIEWDKLPERFILKVTNASGYNLFVENKSTLDIQKATKLLCKAMWLDYRHQKCELLYPPKGKIIAEKMYDEDNKLDYKFFCFNGKVKFVQILNATASENSLNEPYQNQYDENFNRINMDYGYIQKTQDFDKPHCFELMKKVAEQMSSGFKFVRVDFWTSGAKVFLGEFTFFPGSGCDQFNPPEYDLEFGKLIDLSDVN